MQHCNAGNGESAQTIPRHIQLQNSPALWTTVTKCLYQTSNAHRPQKSRRLKIVTIKLRINQILYFNTSFLGTVDYVKRIANNSFREAEGVRLVSGGSPDSYCVPMLF
jgi:hypothetical protein